MIHKLLSARSASALVSLFLVWYCSGHVLAQTSPKMKDAGVANPKTVLYVGNSFFYFRSEEHTSELQSHSDLVCRLLLEKKNTEHIEESGALHQGTCTGHQLNNSLVKPGYLAESGFTYRFPTIVQAVDEH